MTKLQIRKYCKRKKLLRFMRFPLLGLLALRKTDHEKTEGWVEKGRREREREMVGGIEFSRI